MKYALLNGKKITAQPNLMATCLCCGAEVKSYCGEINQYHWRHLNLTQCDLWYENETKWHRDWKNYFDSSYQEVVKHDSKTGEKHIADIYNPKKEVVIELQHSPIKPNEIRAREQFYNRMIWVIDLIGVDKNLSFINDKFNLEYQLTKMRQNPTEKIEVPDSFAISEIEKEMNALSSILRLPDKDENMDYLRALEDEYKKLCKLPNHYLMLWKYRHKYWEASSKHKFIDIGTNTLYELVARVQFGNAYIVKAHDKNKFIVHYQ